VGFVEDEMAVRQVFSEYFGFSLSISFHRCMISRQRTKIIIIFIFIMGLHKEPQDCGASTASAARSFSTKGKILNHVMGFYDVTFSSNASNFAHLIYTAAISVCHTHTLEFHGLPPAGRKIKYAGFNLTEARMLCNRQD
jgi:hypothetical protein